ncbi:MAG: tetratricopeptide repeat protein, partial [Clostridiales bacterium]|nr:tetratricopeptide repeat protein [Clostridiales bacterium]
MEKRDFFISYTTPDEKWATWIAGVLEENSYTTYLQAWDFKPGENFVKNMHKALMHCERFIAVLSAEYMKSVYCQAEWTAAFTKDPCGEKGSFIPIRIEDYKPEGLFAPIIYIDLFGADEKEAEERLKQINKEGIPRNKAGYPGTKKPIFPGQLPLNNIPHTKNLHFTGRKEILCKLENSLNPGEKNPCSIVMYGMGAVGKTQIALAHALSNGYLYDTVWWVNAENEVAMLNSYKSLLLQKGIIKKDIAYDREEILHSIWGWMSQNRNWLFIYDNAESEQDLTPYLPRINTGHILITTRNQSWRNMQKLEIKVFKPQEAVEFLKSFKLKGSIDDAVVLAEELGYLPLALDQAAAYMLESNKSYKEYIDLFIKYRLDIFGKVGYESISYEKTVATTWNISLDKIDNESTKQLIQLLAFLAPDHIHENMFLQTSEYLPEPLASSVQDALEFDKALRELVRYSLVQIDKGLISIHRLLQDVIQQSLGNDRIQCFHCCVRILDKIFAYDQHDMKTWDNCAGLIPHVQSVLSHAEDLKTETEEITGLYVEGAGWLYHTALYKEALVWYQKALAINIKTLGPEHPDTATSYNNIARIYDSQGKYEEALVWYQKALAIYEKTLGLDHPNTATTYNNIAVIYSDQGKHEEALKWHKKALAIHERVLPYNKLDTVATYNNIAIVYDSQRKYEEALKWYKKALAICKKTLGPDHPDTATTYNNIAGIYFQQREYGKALEWFEKALAIYEKTLGPDHPNIATTYINIAGIYFQQGKYGKALEWFEKALAIYEKTLGPDHPNTAMTCNNIAGIYTDQMKYKEALKWHKK